MAITYQFNTKKHNLKKIRKAKSKNIRKQKGVYNVNKASEKLVTDRKERREANKKAQRAEKKARKISKKNKMRTEEASDDEMEQE